MESLFIHFPAPYQEIPTPHVRLACERYQALRATGLLYLQEKGGSLRAYFLLYDGTIHQAYVQESAESFARGSLPSVLNRLSTASVLMRMVEIPAGSMELVRFLLEGAPPEPLLAAQLKTVHALAQSGMPEPRLLRVLWKNGESLVLLTPGAPSQQALHVQQGGRLLTGTNALSVFFSQREDPVMAEWYYARRATSSPPHPETPGLLQAYQALIAFVLARYRDLVGQHLVNSAVFDINAQLMSQASLARLTSYGWELDSESHSVDDIVNAGKLVNAALLRHMEHVLGARLARRIFKEARQHLTPGDVSLLDAHHLIEEQG